MFGSESEKLCDDGFEGSHQEQRIFTEDCFQRDSAGTSERSLTSNVINFECEDSKIADASLCSNSENSAITSQSSSKSLLVEDSETNENSGGAYLSGWFPEGFPLVESDDQNNKGVKRMKFSFDQAARTEPGGVKVFSPYILPNDIATGEPTTGIGLTSHRATLHLLESSYLGVTSSWYLPKQRKGMDRSGNLGVPNCRLDKPGGYHDKEMVAGKAVASTVSQESIATRLLLGGPAATLEKSGSPLLTEERLHMGYRPPDLDVYNTLEMNFKKDPRNFLQSYIIRLLTKAGWSVEKRKRPCRKYLETTYQSPEGRMFREFPNAWRSCGQSLHGDGYSLLQQEKGKEWADISQFWSDLSNALMHIDKEMDQSDPSDKLAHWWSLLDPFVSVVLISKKVGSLRKGDKVRSVPSLLFDKNEDGDAVIASKDEDGIDGIENLSAARNQLAWHDPSLVTPNVLSISAGICHAHNEQSRDNNFSECTAYKNGALNSQMSPVIHIADRDDIYLLDSATGTGNQFQTMHKDKETILDMTLSQACASDGICLLSSSHQANSPATGVNMLMTSEAVFSQQYSSLLSKQQSGLSQGTDGHFIGASMLTTNNKAELVLRKKTRRKSKKISEIKASMLWLGNSVDANFNQLDSKDVKENLFASVNDGRSCKSSSGFASCLHQVEKQGSKVSKKLSKIHGCVNEPKNPTACEIKDDDLLVSAILGNRSLSFVATKSTSQKKACKPRAQMKLKSKRGSCRLLPKNMGKAGKRYFDCKWPKTGARTVLSWLIDVGAIYVNDIIQYRNPKDNDVIKDGLVTREGIICKCCNMLFSLLEFKSHAGYKLSRPCLNLFMESGEPFTLCQLQAWSSEYKNRKSGAPVVRSDEDDENDDSCGLCGDVGELICCDNCPSTYHKTCLSAEELPEGSWYCPNCTCWICGGLVNEKEPSVSFGTYKCVQCEHKYHEACHKRYTYEGMVSDAWFCGESCQEVCAGLSSLVGISNCMDDGLSWTLLKCIHEEQKVCTPQRFALKAECNSKLAVALTIMEECFQPMVDPRTGINMMPQVLYNWGSDFARLNFEGFYSVILEKDDVLVSVASIRIHGTALAEMPLIATCSKYRRQGMCRHLMTAVEEMLTSFKVEKLVISAIPEVVETWTAGFGFTPVTAEEKQGMSKINLMVFPGSILLKKTLYKTSTADNINGLADAAAPEVGQVAVEGADPSNFVGNDPWLDQLLQIDEK